MGEEMRFPRVAPGHSIAGDAVRRCPVPRVGTTEKESTVTIRILPPRVLF